MTLSEMFEALDEPEKGSCWNCDHMCVILTAGREACLCCYERDMGNRVEVEPSDSPAEDCPHWEICPELVP